MPSIAKNVAEDAAAREELLPKTGRLAVPVITVGRRRCNALARRMAGGRITLALLVAASVVVGA